MYFILSNSNIAGGPFVEESSAYSKLHQLITKRPKIYGYSNCYSILQYQSLSKTELELYLRKDYTLSELIPDTSKGEDCMIFKDTWEKSDRIIYIPDYSLNGIIPGRILNAKEIDNLVHSCYTGNDFLRICKGHENVAQALFTICNWQHPDIQDLLDGFDEDEFLETFGIPMDSLEQEVQAWEPLQATNAKNAGKFIQPRTKLFL